MLVERRNANLLNFMYKSNCKLIQENAKQLRGYEADVFIEYISNNDTKLCCLSRGEEMDCSSCGERGLITIGSFKVKQKQKLKNKL